jgi:two-component system, response regulator RpfG
MMSVDSQLQLNMQALSVDNDVINLKLIKALAEEIGLTVKSFQSPIQALNYAVENEVDMVFVDYILPEMDGLSFIREFRRGCNDVPVVMTTAVTDSIQLKLDALEAGATEFLSKPLNSVDFRARVKSLSSLRSAQLQLRDRALSLEREVATATEKIVAREMETLGVLSKAAEFKDTDTGNHVKRVAGYSRVIGEEIISDFAELDLLFYAAPLHDVGKVGIPDTILLKTGRLTAEEWKVMKNHTMIGEKILADCENRVLRTGAVIAKNHHEKFDGSGYPVGLAGKSIPLMGRIVAIADVFDALTTIRPYKKAWSHEKAFDLIAEERGTQFDPILADIFLNKSEHVTKICEELKDNPAVARSIP